MQRTRQERRYLTHKYQARQKKLHKAYYGPYQDWSRRDRDALGYKPNGYDAQLANEGPSVRIVGRWKNMSAFDCGRAGCQLCGSPRRSHWGSVRESLTLQENKNYDEFIYGIAEYWLDK